MPCLKSEVVLLDLEELLGPNQNYFSESSEYWHYHIATYMMLLVIRRINKDQYVFWFWQLSLENWICQRASITTKDDTKTMELTDLVGKKSCYSAQGPRPLSKSKHQVLSTRVSFNYHNINTGICKTLINNAKIFNSEHILYTKNCIQGIFPCVQYIHAQKEIFIHVWVDLILSTQISISSDNFYPLTTFLWI